MKSGQRKYLIALIAFSLLSLLFIQEGYHLWFFRDKYGKVYNDHRMKVGQPLIENYFVEDPARNRQGQSWSAEGSAEPHFHVGKFIYLDLFGRLAYEIDYYKPVIDTLWLRKEIDSMVTSPPIKGLKYKSVHLSRTYYPKTNIINFELDLDFGDGLLFSHPIPYTVGDSIFSMVKLK